MPLQILWQLLHIRPGVSVIGPRVQEILTVCLKQRQEWPQVFRYLVMHFPGKVARQLRQPHSPKTPKAWPTGVSPDEQTALDACQDKRGRVAQQTLAQHQASRGMLPDDVQTKLYQQADEKDADDLEAILLVRPQ